MYIVEGNIGAGKSTLLKALQDMGYDVIQEPVDEWLAFKDNSGNSIFSYFYNNPKEYSFSFQMLVLLTRYKNMLKCGNNSICERSILTDIHVFSKCLLESNLLKDIECSIIKDWFEQIMENNNFNIEGIIYLRVLPSVCMKRIQQRQRENENSIDID